MAFRTAQHSGFSVKAHRGDAKTLLAFSLDNQALAKNLAGFTIQCKPDGQPAYYLLNMLRFEKPADHAQDDTEPPTSSINAPIHKFRWLHVPGSFHQGVNPVFGSYTYTVSPRYFDDKQSLQPLDPALSVSVTIDVVPFEQKSLRVGFTRGFTQSQAFVHQFGLKALIQPKGATLLFDTSQVSGTNAQGDQYTFQAEYDWLGFTARTCIFDILNAVQNDPKLHLDMFAYDLNEPDVLNLLLKLAAQGRIRLLLDDATLHHSTAKPTREDRFEVEFGKVVQLPAAIHRDHFSRFAHDKILIVSDGNGPKSVLTGSTNFSVTGLYVNSNHVLVFADRTVAKTYADIFEAAWNGGAHGAAFRKSSLSGQTFTFVANATNGIPKMEITFSPHDAPTATKILTDMADRIAQEGTVTGGSVLFAVMELDSGTGPVFPALQALHANEKVFSYGVSDTTSGITLYSRGHKTGVLVTGKPTNTKLPPPFDQVPSVGIGHQIHHKFVVCGFNASDPIVYCGSSNLALQGEQVNGDNLIAIHDADVATVFAIEALGLVDHFAFLDRASQAKTPSKPNVPVPKPETASKTSLAAASGWFLSTTDGWVKSYFDPNDLHCADRLLFA